MMDAGPFLVLSAVLIGGTVFGLIAKRMRLPAITGQIVAGVLIGRMGLDLFTEHSVSALHPITEFALGLMAVSVGAHLDLRRLKPMARRLLLLLLLEMVLVTGVVSAAVVSFSDLDWGMGILLGTIGISTAPATVVALVKETRAKGVFVNTLLAGVGLNNLACIFLFEITRSVLRSAAGEGGLDATLFTEAAMQLGEAASAGCLAAIAMFLIRRWVRRVELITTAGFVAILLCVGLAQHFGFSSMLACLFLGLSQANVTRHREEVVDSIFHSFEPAILAAFFALAGMELSLEHAAAAGVGAVVFFASRLVAKLAAGSIAMRLADAAPRIRDRIGLAMIPQAGVAVGLVVLLEEDTVLRGAVGETIDVLTAVVLTAVVMNEVVGPILTRMALKQTGEAGRERRGLMDFIREEHIVLRLQSSTMEEAIEELVQRVGNLHRLPAATREALLEATLKHESEASSCLGWGLAVPSGEITQAEKMKGVLAISDKGFDFETPDGEPLHCILLLAFPESERPRRLRILTQFAAVLGHDAEIRERLFTARSAAEVYEVLLDAELFEPAGEEDESHEETAAAT